MMEVWLTTAYLGPVDYFRRAAQADVVWIEALEHYEKQSWRNRFRIVTANGPLDLSIPVINGASPGQDIRSVRIDYRQEWQKNHFRSVESAYRHAPFYEYFIDDIRRLWEIRPEYLFDYNLRGTELFLKFMKTNAIIRLTEEYRNPGAYGANDLRYAFHPKTKKQGTGSEPVPYHQVFSDRFGFIQEVSILDWIFNDFKT